MPAPQIGSATGGGGAKKSSFGAPSIGSKSSGKSTEEKKATALAQLRTATKRLASGDQPQNRQLEAYSETGKRDAAGQAVDWVSKQPLVKGVSQVLAGTLGRLGQASLRGQQAAQLGQGPAGIIKGIGRGLKGTDKGVAWQDQAPIGFRAAYWTDDILDAGGIDREEATPEQMRGAEQGAQNIGGRWAGALDLAGSIATDPTTLIGGGGGAAAAGKTVKAATKGTQAESLGIQAATRGSKTLDDAGRAQLAAQLKTYAKAQGLKNPDKFVAKQIGGEGNFLTRQRGQIEESQGAKFAGKTVLPNSAVRSAADLTGVSRAGSALSDSRVGTWTKDVFKKRADIADELGQEGAGVVGDIKAAERGSAAMSKDVIDRKYTELGKGIKDAKFYDELSDAVETPGGRAQLASKLKSQGRRSEFEMLKAVDKELRSVTQARIDNGLLKADQVRDLDTWRPRVQTKEASDWAKNKPAALVEQITGFKPSSGGILQNAEAMFRKLDFPTTSEANAHMRELTGVENWFEPNVVKAVAEYASKTADEIAAAKTLKRMTESEVNGSPLVVKGLDAKKTAKASAKDQKAEIKRINTDIEKVFRQTLKSEIKGKERFTQWKSAKNEAYRAGRRVDELTAKVMKARNATIAAGVEKRTAQSLGKNAVWKDDVLQKLETNKSPSAQQRVGRTQSTAKSTSAELTRLEKELAAAKKEWQARTVAANKIEGSIPDSSRTRIWALEGEKKSVRESGVFERAEIRTAEMATRPKGYVEFNAGPLGNFYAPKSILKDLEREFSSLPKDPTALDRLGDMMQVATQAQKNIILSAPPFVVGRLVRDFYTSIGMMWENGFSDVTALSSAAKIANESRKGTKSPLLNKRGSTKSVVEATESSSRLTAQEKQWSKWANEDGVVNTGQVRSDVRHGGLALTKKERTKKALDPRNADSIYTKFGSRAGEQSDDTLRTAMYIDGLKKGMPRAQAARRSRNTMFDYADLTKSESQIRKWVIFYTFMARSFEFEAKRLKDAPVKVYNIERARDAIVGDDQSEQEDTIIPSYLLEGNKKPIATVDGIPIVGTLETPLDAPQKTLQPFFDIASAYLPEKYATQAGIGGGVGGLAGNVGGVPGTIVKQSAEEITGTDLFTGAPMKPEEQTGKESTKRLLSALAPRGQQSVDTGQAAAGAVKQGKMTPEATARLLSLLGVSATAVTPEREVGEIYRRKRVVEDSAGRQGIPTASELKKKAAKKKKE